jgi:peroxiredoxin
MGAKQAQPEPPSASANVGDLMPAYTAKTLDGTPFDLASQKGSVVLVNVWATWCGPCRFEIPELQKMYDQYGQRGFKVVGVSVDEGDAKDVKQFVDEQKMTYPVVLDPDGHIANVLQTTVLPTSVLIDRHGRIVWREVGAIPAGEPTLKKALDAALGGG